MARPNKHSIDESSKEKVTYNEEEEDAYFKSLDEEELDDEPNYPDDEEVWSEEKEQKFENWYNKFHKQPSDIFAIPFGVGIGSWIRLMEVFDIRILSDVGSRHKMSIHGTITIDACNGKDYIFKRTRESPQLIQPGDSLTLTGPNIATPGYDVIALEINLEDGRRELCHEILAIYNFWDRVDMPFTEKLIGQNGFLAEVSYVTYNAAFVVSMEIKLLPKVKELDCIKVYGTIEVSISGLFYGCKKKTLNVFKRKKRNCVSLSGDGGMLPLSRSLVAYPMKEGAFKLHLNLYTTNMVRVASTDVKFNPKSFGEKEVIVESEYGFISVLFTVFHPFHHPASVNALKNNYYRITWPKEYQR